MAQQQQRPRPKSRAASLGSMNGPPAARGASTPGTPRVIVTPTQLDKAQLDKAQLRRHSYTSPLMTTPHGKVRGAWHAVGALCWGGESERERAHDRAPTHAHKPLAHLPATKPSLSLTTLARSAQALSSAASPTATGAEEGSVRVIARLRHSTQRTLDEGPALTIDAEHTGSERGIVAPSGRFAVHDAFGGDASNREVFERVGVPLVEAVLKGYHGSLIAYGQTGSGKTFTLGEPAHTGDRQGLVPRALRQLLESASASAEFEYEVRMQYVQVYLEKIYDLLEPSAAAANPLHVREDANGESYVQV